MKSLTYLSSHCCLTTEFHKDLLWWDKFLDVFNGKTFNFLDSSVVTALSTDTSQKGICSLCMSATLILTFTL